MPELRFEWDGRKALQNKRKHGISFEEASTVFSDDHGLLIDDPDHSVEEDRFLLLGLSASLRTLVVAHCYRKADDVIRITQLERQPGRNETYTTGGAENEERV